MNILHLTLTYQWYDMIEAGIKTEEYREIKPYWATRLIYPHESEDGNFEPHFVDFIQFDQIIFHRGYSKGHKTMSFQHLGTEIDVPKTEWSGNMQGDHFILKLGERIC